LSAREDWKSGSRGTQESSALHAFSFIVVGKIAKRTRAAGRLDANVLQEKELFLATDWNRIAGGASGAVKLDEWAFVDANGAGVLADVADVVNAAGQDLEIAILDGFEGRDFELGVFGDLFERDTLGVPNRTYRPAVHR
jgi:hypothetical protein